VALRGRGRGRKAKQRKRRDRDRVRRTLWIHVRPPHVGGVEREGRMKDRER